jgi:hypothetical protein
LPATHWRKSAWRCTVGTCSYPKMRQQNDGSADGTST